MKIKIFNGFGEYQSDMDFDFFKKTYGFEFAGREEYHIYMTILGLVRTQKKRNMSPIKIREGLKKIFDTTAWETYMYEDRFQYFVDKAFKEA